jgi:hypothetical protein
MAKKWTLIKRLKSGHRVFRSDSGRGTGRLAIADQSGDVPHECDDGVLWLDCERPLKLGLRELVVPVRDRSEHEYVTVADPHDAAALVPLGYEVQLDTGARGFRSLVERLERQGVVRED